MNLQWAKEYVESLGHKVFYIALYGSQNYGLDTSESDFDYKCIILPTLDDLVHNSKPYSHATEFEWGQIEIKDIRSYVDSAAKVNINFIEILNTPYYIWDERLRKYFIPLQEQMGSLYLKACYGMILEKQAALRHPYPSTIHKIEKYGYDPKQLHHIVRLKCLMDRFVNWDFGNYYHNTSEREALIDIKLGAIHNSQVDVIADSYIREAKSIRDSYTKEPTFDAKEAMLAESRDIIKNSIIQEICNSPQ